MIPEMLADKEFLRIYQDSAKTEMEIELFRRIQFLIDEVEALKEEVECLKEIVESCGDSEI